MTQSDDWIPSEDDAPDAPPKKTRDRSSKPRPTPKVVDLRPTDSPWERALARDHHERITKDTGNAAVILSHAAELADRFSYDAFRDSVLVGELPGLPRLPANWPASATPKPPPAGEVNNEHCVYLGLWLRRRYDQTFSLETVRHAVNYAAKSRTVNPLTDYLNGCAKRWDRKPRIESWLSAYLSVEHSVYSCAVGRMWMISACARAFRPGCQVDHMLVLESLKQGEGKTSAARILASGVENSFLARLPPLSNADNAAFAIQGRWIGEIGELDAFRGVGATRVKDFTTTTHDTYRAPYERYYTTRGRTIVFIATTNQQAWSGDDTGARRFWPVRVGTIDRAALARDRDQLWGEAVHAFRNDTPWWPDADLEPALTAEQRERYEGDEWSDRVEAFVSDRESVRASEVLAGPLGLDPKDWTQANQVRVGRILRHAGWHLGRLWLEDGSRPRAWLRK